jgi:hypothetical protein
MLYKEVGYIRELLRILGEMGLMVEVRQLNLYLRHLLFYTLYIGSEESRMSRVH